MAPRVKGRSSKASAPPSVAANPAPVLSADVVIVEAPPSAPSESPPPTQPNKKQKKVSAKKATLEKGGVKVKKEDYNRGRVAMQKTWDGIAHLAPQGTDIHAMKHALSDMRKIAVAQLKQKGSFTLPGICSLRVLAKPGRDAGKTRLFGKLVDAKARPPYKKVYAKSTRCLADSVVKETNK